MDVSAALRFPTGKLSQGKVRSPPTITDSHQSPSRFFRTVEKPTGYICTILPTFVDLLFRSLLNLFHRQFLTASRSPTSFANGPATDPVSIHQIGYSSKENTQKETNPELTCTSSMNENINTEEERESIIPEETMDTEQSEKIAITDVRHTNVNLYAKMKRVFGVVSVIMKNTIEKLTHLPRVLIFMPADLILCSQKFLYSRKGYSDARDKIHNKSSYKLFFSEGDMTWIMSMIFYCEDTDVKPFLCFSAIAGAVFGFIHCTAWNFAFPSHVEKIMWRTASLTLVGLCLSDRKSTRLNSSHSGESRMPSSA